MMRKIIYAFVCIAASQGMHAQMVGIGTSSPLPSTILDLTASDKAFLLPRVPNTGAIATPVNGMMIYDISTSCIRGYEANAWTNCLFLGGGGSGTVTTLNCAGATNNGTLTQNSAASGVSSVISYTGGNGGSYAGQTVSSTGVAGLTATLSAGNFASGSGSLTYTITGTPTASGTASFAITIGGQPCTFTRTVTAASGAITALNCGTATNNGTLTQNSTASGVSSVISYTGGNGGSYAGQTVSSTGVAGLTATLSAGNFASGSGSVTYTITGTPTGSGTASFAISIGGQSCTFTRTVTAASGAITALNCGTATNNGTLTQNTAASGVSSAISYTGGNNGAYNAQNISSTGVAGLTASISAGTFASGSGTLTYTITGTPTSSGTASFAISIGGQSCTLTRTVAGTTTVVLPGNPNAWMRHNLGADTSLDPDQNPSVIGLHGNYYQWGRLGAVANASTPAGAIVGWNTTNAPNNSWQDTTKTANDPCPAGFRVPTSQQFTNLINNNTTSNIGTFADSAANYGSAKVFGSGINKLTLPATGLRGSSNGFLSSRGSAGYYWSSSQSISPLSFSSSAVSVGFGYHTNGFSIRCISE